LVLIFGNENVCQRNKTNCQSKTGHNGRADNESVGLAKGYKDT
jgi:hypothetical protein